MIHYYTIPGMRSRKIRFTKLEQVGVVIAAVCKHFGICKKDIKSKNRSRSICEPRFICLYLLFNVVKLKQSEIAGLFDMDHANVIHAVGRCEDLMFSDRVFFSDVVNIKDKL